MTIPLWLALVILGGWMLAVIWAVRRREAFTRSRESKVEPPTWDAEAVEDFLLVGWFSLDEWLALSPETRSQIARVATAMEKARIVAQGAVTGSRDALVRVGADLDGGKAARDHIMDTTLGMLADRARADALRAAQKGGDR